MTEQNKPLMDLCSSVGTDIFVAERAKAMWLWVSDHADTINDATFGVFFGAFQHMALTEMFVALGRVFDEERHHHKICLNQILVLMRTSNLVDRSPLLEFLKIGERQRREWEALSEVAIHDRAVDMLFKQRPTFNSSEQLHRVLNTRHTEIAHRELDPLYKHGRPKFGDVDHCITWAKDFLGMAGRAYGNRAFKSDNGNFWTDGDVASSVMSMRRLAHKSGIVVDQKFAEMDRLAAMIGKD